MNIQISFTLSILAGLGTLLGSMLIFIPKINKHEYIPLFLSISATIMMSFSIFDLIPKNAIYILNNYHLLKGILYISISFGLGYTLINILDKYTKVDNKLYKISILSFVSLIIHNFPEGIATFLTSMLDIKLGLSLSIGILMHNIPEGICIALPIYQVTKSKRKVLIYCLIVSIAEPFGAIIAYLFLKDFITNLTISLILLFVSGLMITLSINNIYKEIRKSRLMLLLGILIGLILTSIALLMN